MKWHDIIVTGTYNEAKWLCIFTELIWWNLKSCGMFIECTCILVEWEYPHFPCARTLASVRALSDTPPIETMCNWPYTEQSAANERNVFDLRENDARIEEVHVKRKDSILVARPVDTINTDPLTCCMTYMYMYHDDETWSLLSAYNFGIDRSMCLVRY